MEGFMGYYMRYVSDDDRETNISIVERALRALDAKYGVEKDTAATNIGELTYDGEVYGSIEINESGEELFEEEIEELKENIGDISDRKAKTVIQALTNAKTIIAIQVLFQDRTIEETLIRIDPLWNWLFDNRKGLLQADGEGYYGKSGLVLEET
jgi:hypothetical protein